MADGFLCATLLGQLLDARLFLTSALLLGLLQAPLLGQLLCARQLDLAQTLLLCQLLCPLLLGLLQTLLLCQLLRPLLLGLLQTLLLCQLLCPLLLGLLQTLLLCQLLCPPLLALLNAPLFCQLLCARLLQTLLLSQLLCPLLLCLLHPLLIGEPLGTFLLSPLLPSLLGQLPGALLFGLALRFLTRARLRVFGGTLRGEPRLELLGLFRELPSLLLGVPAQPVLRVGSQPGVVRFTLPDAVTLAFVRQTGSLGLCLVPGRRVVGAGLLRRRRFLRTGGRLRSGIGFHGRKRDLERRRPLRFLCDHACVQAIGHARRRRLAAAFCRPPRWRCGRGRRRSRRRHDGIDEPEAVMRHIRRRIRPRLRQRHGRGRRRRRCR
ncbi:hypothetical protein NX784_14150 [Massilia pinisoli]|uniref:Uncharacterized protein n=1 Tax=Massilia pinisoli TaxID=1772194 RepID=A0ABT1ZS35_9BURK|nr:hypothetical protein [Massilia pinisoli]MCS0582732.1 hypothetical protein [Massilia pinisoli]